jgi:ribosomal protein S18 acetylase RimI-like enzyme
MMKIRRAELNDIPGLVNLWIEFMDFHTALDAGFVRSANASENWTAYIKTKLTDNDVRILVAEMEESLVGYVVATVNEYPPIITLTRYGFISDIAVTAEHRQQGIAHQLFETAENWLLSVGVSRIELKVDVLNDVSRSFWEKEGFKRHTETLIKKY